MLFKPYVGFTLLYRRFSLEYHRSLVLACASGIDMTEFVVDSTPTWKAKFEHLGIDMPLVERFQKEKFDTVSKFANTVGLPPETAEADAKFVAEVKAITGADPPIELSRGGIDCPFKDGLEGVLFCIHCRCQEPGHAAY
eukprot:5790539-Amphidinium_carterae.2